MKESLETEVISTPLMPVGTVFREGEVEYALIGYQLGYDGSRTVGHLVNDDGLNFKCSLEKLNKIMRESTK